MPVYDPLLSLWEQPPAWWGWVASLWVLVALVQAGYVLLEKRAPVSTLAWILVLVLLPVAGLVAYFGFGPQRVKRQRLRRLRGRAALPSKDELQALRGEHPDVPLRAVQHARLIERACGLPVSSAQRVDVLRDGAATLEAVLDAVRGARSHVHLEYYIFEPDEVGRRLVEALVERLAAGVTVRLLVDAVGSGRLTSWRRRAFLDAFRAAGGQFAVFHPARLDRRRPLVNLRTHRKIVVVDGRIGFTGGINVTEDEHEGLRPDAYRDTHLRVEGAAVRWLQLLFLEDWVYARGRRERTDHSPTLRVDEPAGPVAVQFVASGPDAPGEAIHRSMNDAMAHAEQRVWLTTPYFVPTEPALFALTDAALRGVDVRVLVPRRGDSRIVTWAARSYFDELLASGVRVFEYRPRMLHAKTLVVDDAYAQVGSANYDHRSFRLNFEVAAAVYDAATCRALADDFERDLAKSREVRRGDPVGRVERLAQAFARLLSPVL